MTDAPGHVWVDGRLHSADDLHLSVFDRGFQLGDGVFETLRARAGHPAELAEHLERLRRSADGLGIELQDDLEAIIAGAIGELLRANELDGPDGDASVRITLSRGAYRGRGLLPPNEHVRPTLAVQAWPVPAPPAGHLERGLALVASAVRRDPESPLAALKTTSRADYVYARLEARRAGADDALFLTTDGFLSEATSANVFIVRRPRRNGGPGGSEGPGGSDAAELATPAIACAILPGTTRGWILGWAREAGLATAETWLTTADLLAADEAFLSSSVAGILPLTSYEGAPIGDGRPGVWTARARDAREAFLRAGGTGGGTDGGRR
ncbi:MAG TPA: aminotransferase class IV [Candidatus Polarisedimenticolia bacterium]|nr:aminotransferase class IV [Candidatus Polarisedimenticolia bacterium]